MRDEPGEAVKGAGVGVRGAWWRAASLLLLAGVAWGTWQDTSSWLAVLLAVAAWAVVGIRRIDADVAAAVLVALGGLQLVLHETVVAADVLLLVAYFGLGERGRRRLWPVWGAALLGGAGCAAVRWTQDEVGFVPPSTYRADLIVTGAVVALLGLLAWAAGALVTAWRLALQQQQQAAAEALRTELSQEVHDIVGHALALIAVQAEAGRFVATESDVELTPAERLGQAARTFETVRTTAREALDETRALTRSLATGDPGSAPSPTVSDIADLVHASRDSSVPVRLSVRGEPVARLGPRAQLALYRVAQEGITNALKHAASATRIDVHVIHTAEDVTVRVTDDATVPACGLDGGQGLRNLRRRLGGVGGTLLAEACEGGGVRLEARVPAKGMPDE